MEANPKFTREWVGISQRDADGRRVEFTPANKAESVGHILCFAATIACILYLRVRTVTQVSDLCIIS
jgi:hypothetical protein